MGKGIALAFKDKFPMMFWEYRRRCKTRQIKPGHIDEHVLMPYYHWTPIAGQPRVIVNFPTKAHWSNPSKLEWIETGLVELAEYCNRQHVFSIAIPPLGCGNGGLDWTVVYPLIQHFAAQCPNTEVRVYLP